MRPYLVVFTLLDDTCYQEITYVVIAKNREQAIKLCDDKGRAYSSNWEVSVKRIKGNKPKVITQCIE